MPRKTRQPDLAHRLAPRDFTTGRGSASGILYRCGAILWDNIACGWTHYGEVRGRSDQRLSPLSFRNTRRADHLREGDQTWKLDRICQADRYRADHGQAAGTRDAHGQGARAVGGDRQMNTRSINGVELCYRDLGSGTPIIFLHAFPLSQTMWDAQVDRIAANHRV